MPVHNWKKAPLRLFHHFHQRWSCAICDGLNSGLLPKGFYALIEQHAGALVPDLLTLQRRSKPGQPRRPRGGLAIAELPPKTQIVLRASEAEVYAAKANKIVIRDSIGDLVSVLEIVSPGNKHSRLAVRHFLDKSIGLLRLGIHLLVIDVFPPSRRDPQGLHQLIWNEIDEDDFHLPRGKPLTLVSYCCGFPLTAFVEPLALGSRLPAMPVFLDSETYVSVPLEETYAATWALCPEELKEAIPDSSK